MNEHETKTFIPANYFIQLLLAALGFLLCVQVLLFVLDLESMIVQTKRD